MTRLVIMRHATAVTHAPSDWARPLSERGATQAREAGQWLRSRGIVPDGMIVSSSVRTMETAAGLGLAQPALGIDEAYNASGGALAELVRACAGQVVLVVAHNPGVTELARACGGEETLVPGSAVVVDWDGPASVFADVPVQMVGTFTPTP